MARYKWTGFSNPDASPKESISVRGVEFPLNEFVEVPEELEQKLKNLGTFERAKPGRPPKAETPDSWEEKTPAGPVKPKAKKKRAKITIQESIDPEPLNGSDDKN